MNTQAPSRSTCAASGVPGVPGVPGLNGRDGAKGDQGSVVAPGKMGPKGLQGSKGAKGEQATTKACQKNWKQCAWKDINDGRDYGLIKVRTISLKIPYMIGKLVTLTLTARFTLV